LAEYISESQFELLGKYAIEGANESLGQRNFQLAQQLYLNAYSLNPAFLNKNVSLLPLHPLSFAELTDITYIDDWETKYLGEYWQPLTDWYWKRMNQAIMDQEWNDFDLSMSRLLEIDHQFAFFIWRDLSLWFDEQIQSNLLQNNQPLVDELLFQWQQSYLKLNAVSPSLDPTHQFTCLLVKNTQKVKSVQTEMNFASTARSAESIIPGIHCPWKK
jgi:hypothetical protein